MAHLSKETLLQQLQWRYAVKRFDATKKIPEAEWDVLEATLVLSPSSYGLQPWKFLVVQSPEIRKMLTPASWNQTQVRDCSHFVVLLGKTEMDPSYIDNYLGNIISTRKVPEESLAGYKKMLLSVMPKMSAEWAARQVYIALGNLMTAAAVIGIDTCPMEGIDPNKYDEILGVKGSGYGTLVACAVGYRSPEDKYAQATKVRFDRKDVVTRV